MSSSSSYSNFNNNPRKVVAEHDVFLSFRGEDTRSGFTNHLYDALVREGIRTFFDDDNLVRGKVISTGLMKAIQGSRRSVVILSENYAFSSWCLTELCKIVECMDTSGLIVLPIFYHVNPSHVRKLIGSYRDAFKKHDNNPKLDLEEVETWRDALKRVGNLAGWTLEEGDVEAKFIKDFIADISSQLDIRNESPREPARRSRLQDVVYFDHNLVSKMVDPANAPIVVGKLRDDECPEDFIRGYLLPIRSLKESDKRDIEAHIVQNFIQDVPQVTNDTTKEKNVILTKKMRKKKKKKNVINTTIGKDQSFLSEPQSSKMLDTSDDGQDHDEDRLSKIFDRSDDEDRLSKTIEPSAEEDCWSKNVCPRDNKDCWSNFFEPSADEDRWSKTLDRSDNQDLWSNFFNQ